MIRAAHHPRILVFERNRTTKKKKKKKKKKRMVMLDLKEERGQMK